MESGRMPASDTIYLRRGNTASVPNEATTRQDDKDYYCGVQVLIGNRCGHDKKHPPVFQEPKHHKQRPHLIVEARKRLRKTYYNPYIYAAGKMTFHKTKLNKNGSIRKMRSEQRAAVTHSVGEAILHYANIEAMAVGFRDLKANKFINIGITQISKQANVSYDRVRTALKAFEEAGTITIEQSSYKTSKGTFKKNNAYIRLSKEFFYNLGFDDIDIQNYASKQKADEQRKILEQKRSTHNHKERVYLKIKKAERLTSVDKSKINKEIPKFNRVPTTSPSYTDYTGTASQTPRSVSDIATQSLKSILSKLRSP